MAAQVADSVATPAAEAALAAAKESFHCLIFKEGISSRSFGRVLDRWLKDTKQFSKSEVGTSVRVLRKRKKFSLALKFFETASKRGLNLTARGLLLLSSILQIFPNHKILSVLWSSF
ncbi:unnamed protein product [Victoria cruziana]